MTCMIHSAVVDNKLLVCFIKFIQIDFFILTVKIVLFKKYLSRVCLVCVSIASAGSEEDRRGKVGELFPVVNCACK